MTESNHTDRHEKLLDDAIGAWETDGASPYMDTRMFARIAEERQSQHRRRWAYGSLGASLATAMVAVVIYVGTPLPMTDQAVVEVALLDDIEMLEQMDLLQDDAAFEALMAFAEAEDAG